MRRSLLNVIVGAAVGTLIGLTVASVLVLVEFIATISAEPEVFKRVGEQTYKIVDPSDPSHGGTGFVAKGLSGKTYMVTNAHVCSISTTGYMLAVRGARPIRLNILNIADDTDLCLLEAPVGKEGLYLAKSIHQGDRVFLVGHPLLQPLTITHGYVAYRTKVSVSYCNATGSVRKVKVLPSQTQDGIDDLLRMMTPDCIKSVDAYYATMNSMPGNSGSAVTDKYGDVVGVLFAGNGHGLSVVIPLDVVKEYLSNY